MFANSVLNEISKRRALLIFNLAIAALFTFFMAFAVIGDTVFTMSVSIAVATGFLFCFLIVLLNSLYVDVIHRSLSKEARGNDALLAGVAYGFATLVFMLEMMATTTLDISFIAAIIASIISVFFGYFAYLLSLLVVGGFFKLVGAAFFRN